MGNIWFCLVALMLMVYVVLDGFDLGAGAVHLFVAKTDTERRQVIRSIGPVWDGNEVWLIAAGGTLYFTFPLVYASSFSGFYLPLMMVLWLFVLRGISVEFRTHVDSYAGRDRLLRVRFPADVPGGLPVYQTATAVIGRSIRKGASSSRCGQISASVERPVSSTGTPSLLVLRRFVRCCYTVHFGSP